MPWVSTVELPNPRRGKVNYAAKREYERTWRVQMSLPTDGSIQVSVAPGIPLMFSAYIDADNTFDLGAILYELSAEQQPDMLWWIVTGKYASGERSRYSKFSPEKGDNRFNDPNPLNRPPQLVFGSAKHQKPALVDQNKVAIRNFLGDAFDPAVTVQDDRTTLTLIQNEAGYDPSLTVQYQGAINSDNFLGQPPCCVKLTERGARSNVENNFLYWEVTYQFEFRQWLLDPSDEATWNLVSPGPPGLPGYVQNTTELGWLVLKRNEGLYQGKIVNGNLVYVPILDGNGRAVVSPKDLSVFSPYAALPAGSQPYYLVFHVYPELPFGNLLTAG